MLANGLLMYTHSPNVFFLIQLLKPFKHACMRIWRGRCCSKCLDPENKAKFDRVWHCECKVQPSRVSCDHVTKIRHTNRTRVRKLFHTWTAKCHHTDTLPGLRPRILTELTLSVPVCFSISIKLHVSVSLCSVAACLLHLITPSISLFAHSCSQISLKTACYNLLSLCESWNHRCRQFSINVDAMSLPQIQAGLCYFEFGNTTSLGRVLHF